jgi:hypothetical protein
VFSETLAPAYRINSHSVTSTMQLSDKARLSRKLNNNKYTTFKRLFLHDLRISHSENIDVVVLGCNAVWTCREKTNVQPQR